MKINFKNIKSFLIGLFFSTLFLIVFLFFFLFLYSSYERHTLEEVIEENRLFIISTLIISISTILICWFLIAKNKKSSAIGIGLPSAFYIISIAIPYINDSHVSHVEFNKYTWESNHCKPYEMAASMVKYKELIGLSCNEVYSKLGSSQSIDVDNYWTMHIFCENDTVVRCTLIKGSTGFDGNWRGMCE